MKHSLFLNINLLTNVFFYAILISILRKRRCKMRSTEENLFELISSVVFGKKISITELSKDEIVDIYKISRSHNIIHLPAAALIDLGLLNDEKVHSFFEKRLDATMFRSLSMQYTFDKCCELLEGEKIDYIPLKGAVLRTLYPQMWMRSSVDIDILVKPEDHTQAVDALVNKLGLVKTDISTSHDVTLRTDNGTCVEIHFDLIEEDIFPEAQKILSDIWSFSKPHEGYSHRYQIEMNIVYFYHVVHLAKHMKLGGGGIKDFIDLYLLYISGQNVSSCKEILKKGKMLQFAEAAEKLCRVWFDGEEHNNITRSLADFVMSGGLFGSSKNSNILERKRRKTKLGYYFSHMFVPYDYLKELYPIIEKHPYLTPLYGIKRLWDLAFGKKREHRKLIVKNYSEITEEEINNTKNLWNTLGL